MKNFFLSLVLVIVGLVSKAQEPQYFFPNYESQYVLDSLNIPYVPIPQRNKTSNISLNHPFKRSILKHNRYFNKHEFDFNPSEKTPSILWEVFSKPLKFLNEYENFQNSLFIDLKFEVIGFSKVNLTGEKYKSIQIIEIKFENKYFTVVLLENKFGFVFFLDNNNYKVS